MITIIITSYREPKSTQKAIDSFLQQNIPKPFKIIVADPFPEIEELILNQYKNHPEVEYFEDPDQGKSFALNLLLKKSWSSNPEDILIFTDGDVYTSNNSVHEILSQFKDKETGIVCGHPTTINPRTNKFGYWSHLLFDEMNKTRKALAQNKEFFEVSGYLFAMRNSIIKEFPIAASEDNVLPIMFWQQGYKVGYAEQALVYVMNPQNKQDWINQKKRNIKGHIALSSLFPDFKRRKNTMLGESLRGLKILFSYPRSIKEFFWTISLMFARLQVWRLAKQESKSRQYQDGWRGEAETPTTRILD
ncbi:MAG TPA: glycosyltransferase family 2 protein [Candidatus Nanoarchaeia archaeon]|nr:glycosyltransferase family 2 protein [Candidatus Nanoarchaeia archaeon]